MQLSTPQGNFQLARYPARHSETLRAWDAADEYLLNYFSENLASTKPSKLLILNDNFGALATALSSYAPTSQSDSFLAHAATKQNLAKNNISSGQVKLLSSLEPPTTEAFDVVLIKSPKNLSFLEDQLLRLRPFLHPETNIVAAGMVKYVHASTLKVYENTLGNTTTSLAKKKARLIFIKPEKLRQEDSPYPKYYTLENTQFQICNHANIFSRDSLDIGTRFFLEHIPSSDKEKHILDLGCGNGVVGMMAATKNPNSRLTFTDESFMAIESAKATFYKNIDKPKEAEFHATNCLEGITNTSIDLILNNPPFHQGNTVGDHIAMEMFKDSKRALKKGGELWVIGNRHLGYHVKLKKLYGNCELVASNKKFVILKTIKT
ncbi:MAG: methyltransferase [Cellvibrionaceae bacterium]